MIERLRLSRLSVGRMSKLSVLRKIGESSRHNVTQQPPLSLAVSNSTPYALQEGEHKGLDKLIEAIDGTHAAEPEAEVPQRWIEACEGDEDTARVSWENMARFRESHKLDTILDREQKDFFVIKKLYPQFWLGQDPEGNLVTLELLRDTRNIIKALRHAGISSDRFARHQMFLTEFWIRKSLSRSGRIVRIIDVQNTPIFAQVFGSVRQYFGAAMVALSNYPGITSQIYFVNASRSFRLAWSLMSGFLDEQTRASVIILNKASELPRDILPDVFAGKLTSELEHVGIEAMLSKYVRHLNSQFQSQGGPRAGEDIEDHEPAVISTAEQLMNILPGSWTLLDIESEPMTPIWKAAGVPFVARTALSMLTIYETIQLDRNVVTLTTWAGPVFYKVAQAVLADLESGSDSTSYVDSHIPDQTGKDPQISMEVVSRPSDLVDAACSPCLCVTYTFENGDVMSQYHAVYRFSKDQKVTYNRYRKKGGKTETCLLLLSKKSAK